MQIARPHTQHWHPRRVGAGAACVVALALSACGSMSTQPAPGQAAKPKPAPIVAVSTIEATKGNHVSGSARFQQEEGESVIAVISLSGLPPGSEHGFHIHEKGDCSAPDAMSAGGHFNPDATPHGPQAGPHHAGDMPALKADANGVVSTSLLLRGVTVSAGPHSIVGKSLIVHKDPDDYTTQPTGNSGARVACGVIRLR